MKLTIDQELALFDMYGKDGIPEDIDEGEEIRRRAEKLAKKDQKSFNLHYAYYLRQLQNEQRKEDPPEGQEV